MTHDEPLIHAWRLQRCIGQKIQKEITFASSIVVQASNLFNLPLTFSLDESSTDITQWSTSNFVYCHQVQLRQTIPIESSSASTTLHDILPGRSPCRP